MSGAAVLFTSLVLFTLPEGLVRSMLSFPAWPDMAGHGWTWPDMAAKMAHLDQQGVYVVSFLWAAQGQGVGVDRAVAAILAQQGAAAPAAAPSAPDPAPAPAPAAPVPNPVAVSVDARAMWVPLTEGLAVPNDLDLADRPAAVSQRSRWRASPVAGSARRSRWRAAGRMISRGPAPGRARTRRTRRSLVQPGCGRWRLPRLHASRTPGRYNSLSDSRPVGPVSAGLAPAVGLRLAVDPGQLAEEGAGWCCGRRWSRCSRRPLRRSPGLPYCGRVWPTSRSATDTARSCSPRPGRAGGCCFSLGAGPWSRTGGRTWCAAQAQLPGGLVIDGELIVRDVEEGRLSFEALQRRAAAGSLGAPSLAARRPAYFVASDVLQKLPLLRKRVLLTAAPGGHRHQAGVALDRTA